MTTRALPGDDLTLIGDEELLDEVTRRREAGEHRLRCKIAEAYDVPLSLLTAQLPDGVTLQVEPETAVDDYPVPQRAHEILLEAAQRIADKHLTMTRWGVMVDGALTASYATREAAEEHLRLVWSLSTDVDVRLARREATAWQPVEDYEPPLKVGDVVDFEDPRVQPGTVGHEVEDGKVVITMLAQRPDIPLTFDCEHLHANGAKTCYVCERVYYGVNKGKPYLLSTARRRHGRHRS